MSARKVTYDKVVSEAAKNIALVGDPEIASELWLKLAAEIRDRAAPHSWITVEAT